MSVRTSEAVWTGTLREGVGTMKLGSGYFEGPYSKRRPKCRISLPPSSRNWSIFLKRTVLFPKRLPVSALR